MSALIQLETRDGIRLEARHYRAGHGRVVLCVPGFLQNKDTAVFREISECFLSSFDVLTLDLRGHGGSGGCFTLSAKEALDVEAALGFLNRSYSAVGVIGFSFGAVVALTAAARTAQPGSMIAVSPFSCFSRIDCRFWRREAFDNLLYNFSPRGKGLAVRLGNPFLKKPKPIDEIAKIEAPVLLIHGSRDWIIRPHHSRRLYEKAAGMKRLEIIENGLHGERLFEQDPPRFQELTLGWFRETL